MIDLKQIKMRRATYPGQTGEQRAEFIAHAPADIDILVKEVEELNRLLLIQSWIIESAPGMEPSELKEEVTKLGYKLMSEKP